MRQPRLEGLESEFDATGPQAWDIKFADISDSHCEAEQATSSPAIGICRTGTR